MTCPPAELLKKCESYVTTWRSYRAAPSFEHFVEFAVTLSSFAEFLNSKGLSGLNQLSRDLEQQALALFGGEKSHPISAAAMTEIDQRVELLKSRVNAYIDNISRPIDERRARVVTAIATDLSPGRRLWLVCENSDQWFDLTSQLGYFGIQAEVYSWRSLPQDGDEPTSVVIDIAGVTAGEWASQIKTLRTRFAVSNLLGLSIPADFRGLQTALNAGCDFCFPKDTPLPTIVAKILELNDSNEEPAYKVLVVEDSQTAIKLIQRALDENGVESLAIDNPGEVLDALKRYQPDLILMDMNMPDCTGVEAARVIRQHPEFLSVPIVYLSGETDIGLQVDALRLGGDHFLTKPFNPIVLNAVVQSKIERYRLLRRSMFQDSLTGLFNHTSSKQKLDAAIETAVVERTELCVAMIDIDHFKRVNDSYGHPVGDHVIRSLAWLLRRRLRKSDIVGRYGGEEFLVTLPNTRIEDAYQVLDRIRRDFGQIKHPFNETWFNTTYSSGLAAFPTTSTGEDLVKAADEALYEAKRAGRNQVMIYLP